MRNGSGWYEFIGTNTAAINDVSLQVGHDNYRTGKSRFNSRITPVMYVWRSIMYEKLHFVSRNWYKEKIVL